VDWMNASRFMVMPIGMMGLFRVMLAGVGVGCCLAFPDCVGGFCDG
jgi:hypothetical protein